MFSVNAAKTGTELDGEKFQVLGLRMSNALISDQKTQQLIDHMDEFASYGVNTVSVFFQGSRFGDVKGYRRDASLRPACALRMGRIIEAADRRGMVVLVGCLYYGDSKAKWEDWTQQDALGVECHVKTPSDFAPGTFATRSAPETVAFFVKHLTKQSKPPKQ